MLSLFTAFSTSATRGTCLLIIYTINIRMKCKCSFIKKISYFISVSHHSTSFHLGFRYWFSINFAYPYRNNLYQSYEFQCIRYISSKCSGVKYARSLVGINSWSQLFHPLGSIHRASLFMSNWWPDVSHFITWLGEYRFACSPVHDTNPVVLHNNLLGHTSWCGENRLKHCTVFYSGYLIIWS